MRDDTLVVSVPAPLLSSLTAQAAGYTMSRGQFLSKQDISQAYWILYESGYETYQDETLF